MPLTKQQIQLIRQLASQVAGSQSRVRVFGSRLDDAARGGDLDLLLELSEPVDNPALMAAKLSAQISRSMHGRKVDVLLSAPNLMRLPMHDIAFKEGGAMTDISFRGGDLRELGLPSNLHSPVLCQAITEIQINQTLIRNASFICHSLEVPNNILRKTHGDGLFEF